MQRKSTLSSQVLAGVAQAAYVALASRRVLRLRLDLATARKDLGGHEAYGYERNARELLEFMGKE